MVKMNRWNNLSLREKNQLLGIYASKGYTDLASIINHYNTFQAGGRLTFNEWKSQMQSKYPNIEMDNTKAGYDYVRYFNDNYDDAIRQLSELRHFPDTYKLPNHKTFSNESIYSRGPMMGGNWVNDSTFSPSIINRQQYPNIYKKDRPYTEREIYGNKYQQGGSLGHVIPSHKFQYGNSLSHQNKVVDNWMYNWYNNRVPIAMRNMMQYEGVVAEPKDLFKNLRITKDLLNNALYNTRKTPTTYAPLSPNLNGVYRDDRGDILLQYDAADDVLIHEKSHALHDFLGNRWEENGRVMQDAPFWEAIGEVTSDDLYEDENGKYIYDEYLDDVNEIYSRLMQIRYNNNLDPRHRYTIKEIQDLRRKGKLNLPKSDGLERYTDKFIQHLFNEVAYNSVNNTLSNIAAKGGSLGKVTPFGNLYQEGGPIFKKSQEQYYDRDNDIIYANDSIGEGYQHEYFHARPNTTLLNSLKPYYENLNDERLVQLGADLPFVKRLDNDPNHFYSPEELGARVTAAKYMLNKAGVNNINIDFLRNARQNELQYGDNFRDLLHMYNDENLSNILNIKYSKGGPLGHITPYGQWQYPNEVTTIPSNNITMKGVDYPVIGVSNTGDTKYMLPNMDYLFDGQYVTEYPISYQKGGQLKRVRRNDSPTQVASEKLEDKTAQHIQRFNANKIDHSYDIPYISEKEIVVPGVGRVSTNALDSIAKYSVMAGIPLEEGLGLAAQETAFGANPYYNYGSNNEANRALGNSSYFRNYGVIPANYLVRDWHYFDLTDEQRATTPPLLDAFKYWKAGNYNRGDTNHTSDVKSKGRQVIQTAPIQEWMKTSPYVKKKTSKRKK